MSPTWRSRWAQRRWKCSHGLLGPIGAHLEVVDAVDGGAEVGGLNLAAVANLVGRALDEHAAESQNGNALGSPRHELEFVLHRNERGARSWRTRRSASP